MKTKNQKRLTALENLRRKLSNLQKFDPSWELEKKHGRMITVEDEKLRIQKEISVLNKRVL